VLTNQSLAPGLVKIGRTSRTARLRAQELSHATGVPEKFEVAHEKIVSDVTAVESKVHKILADYRVNKRREFFQIPTVRAIEVVETVAADFVVDLTEINAIDMLPGFEKRMRRWLRPDLVAVNYHQFPDLCVVKWVTQPDLRSEKAIEHIFDLSVFGDQDLERIYPFDGKVFSPIGNTPEENARELLELDPYSMIMTGLDILSDEAANHVADLVEHDRQEPAIRPSWRVAKRELYMWNSNKYPMESSLSTPLISIALCVR
jgi:hypothetical protein